MAEITRDILSLRRAKRLKIVLLLTSGYFVAEVIGGLLTNSLALLADAGHMLTDVGGLALALFAITYARRPATPQRTYGFYRMEILASLTNSVVLVSLSIYIFYEAYRRFLEPPEVESFSMTIIAAIGLVINYVGLKLLGGLGHLHAESDSNGAGPKPEKEQHEVSENLNIQGARIELLSDTLGSIGVVAAGLIIMATGVYLVDPIVSAGLAFFILPRTWRLMKKSIHILMEGVPSNISYEEVKKAILEVKGVTGVFDIHIWTVTSGMDALSAHVVVIDTSRSQTILQELNSLLERRFRIAHATIQIERYHSETDTTF
ncbi:MAG TPA: cation diffusion facilitator family transporter [Nitrososphaera sp.]|nr:cation diffusion facilitator family transporter [Nitrososphaera sp.]